MAYNIPFRNDSGDEIPAFAVMRCTGSILVDDVVVLTMDYVSDDLQRLYYINGECAVEDASYGECTDALQGPSGDLSFAQWTVGGEDDADEPANQPAFNQQWGPQPWEFALFKDCYGFNIRGPFIREGKEEDETDENDEPEEEDDDEGDAEDDPDEGDVEEDEEDPGEDESDPDEEDEDDGDSEDDEEDTDDGNLDRVVVQQEWVNAVYGVVEGPVRMDVDITDDDPSQAYADVAINYLKVDLSASPVTYALTSTGFKARKVKAMCVQTGNQVISGDQVILQFMAGQWVITQVQNCPGLIT